MVQRCGDFGLAEAGAVIAIDQQGDTAAAVDMPRPTEGLVERGKFLVEKLILLHGGDRFRAARADINAIAHRFSSFENTKGAQGLSALSSRPYQSYSDGMGRSYGTALH